jgi:protein SCO1
MKRAPTTGRVRRLVAPTNLICVAIALVVGHTGFALIPDELIKIGFEQNVGRTISRDLLFRDADGSSVKIGNCIGGKPTLLILGYYHCPMLCTLINDGLINALQQLRIDVGKDFNAVDVSIDPRETPALAATRKNQYLKRYGRAGASDAWHFLTGDQSAVTRLTSEAGFHFVYDPESNEYAHPSGVIVLTPKGKISRYFLGVNIDPRELNLAIRAASRGESGSVINRFALLCYHYNPITGKYGATIMSILRASGIATVLAIGFWIFFLTRKGRELANWHRDSPSPQSSPTGRGGRAAPGEGRRVVS